MSLPIRELFHQDRRSRPARFMPYVCVGYPTFGRSLAIAMAALDAGADALELGIPFSDPVADGPTLQRATHRSLQRGTRVADAFRLVRALRKRGYHQPLLVMTYLNPLEQMGWRSFAGAFRNAGGDGLIVPDLPTERMKGPSRLLARYGLALIPFLSPTSGGPRIRKVEALGAPFLYYVSVTGVTGARKDLAQGLVARLRALRGGIRTPVVVGFGISNARQAGRLAPVVDGIIIASALINLIDRTPSHRVQAAVGRYCRGIVRALGRQGRES